MQKINHFFLIARFVYEFALKRKVNLIFAVIFTGVINKLMSLILMVAVFQSIVAVLFHDKFLILINKLLTQVGLSINSDQVLTVVIGLIILLQIISVITQAVYSKLLNMYVHEALIPKADHVKLWSLNDDVYMIENFTKVVITVAKTLTSIVYLLVLVLIIAYFSITFVFVLIPGLVLFVLMQVFAARKDLMYRQALVKSRKDYLENYSQEQLSSKEEKINTGDRNRDGYIQIKRRYRNYLDIKNQYSAVLGTALIVFSIYFLSTASDINREHLTGALILFIFAIRSIVATGKELSINVSYLAELRRQGTLMRQMLNIQKKAV